MALRGVIMLMQSLIEGPAGRPLYVTFSTADVKHEFPENIVDAQLCLPVNAGVEELVDEAAVGHVQRGAEQVGEAGDGLGQVEDVTVTREGQANGH